MFVFVFVRVCLQSDLNHALISTNGVAGWSLQTENSTWLLEKGSTQRKTNSEKSHQTKNESKRLQDIDL